MHDTHFAQEAIAAVKAKLKAMPAAQVKAVGVSLSPASHVTAESLNAAFNQQLTQNGLKNIDLKVDILDIEIHCKSCDNRLATKGPLINCPRCQSAELEIKLPGKEFSVRSLEINEDTIDI